MTAGWSAWWHDVECASYGVDLPLWRELADAAHGPILDVGCGTGRVALDLAARGHEVVGVDADPELVQLLAARARELSLPVRAVTGDARTLDLGSTFALAILPMQVAQLLGGESGRAAMLSAMRRHLKAGGLLAIALADPSEEASADDLLPPLPDMGEQDGWVLTSTPVAMREEAGGVAIDRHRQAVSPKGELTESMNTIFVELVPPAALEAEGAAAGFSVRDGRAVPPTRDYVGSTVVLLEAP
jgi:SAM-dependent methyltransferase